MRGSCFLSRFEPTDFQRDNRFALRHLMSNVHKSSSIRNGLYIQHNDARLLVFRQSRQRVRLVHIYLVAKTDQLRETKALAARPVDDRRAERTRLRDETNMTLAGHRPY